MSLRPQFLLILERAITVANIPEDQRLGGLIDIGLSLKETYRYNLPEDLSVIFSTRETLE